MKTRSDYVTNSSSSSFIISKKYLDEEQVEAIKNHRVLAERLGLDNFDDPWDIEENDDYITGYTCMDNFDMDEFLEKIEVPSEKVHWDEFEFDLSDKIEFSDEDVDADVNIDYDSNWQNLLHEDEK